jgi:sugar phosphate isomerase/epimerase
MKHAISNIALPQFDHSDALPRLAGLGFLGLEVAPSRVWADTWQGLPSGAVEAYRARIEGAGLRVVGLHSLLFDQPGLALCDGEEKRGRLLDFFVHLSAMCRDLGGRTLIWGGGRKRGKTAPDEAHRIVIDFFGALADRIDGHGTVFCLEPLTPKETDFIHLMGECADIVAAVDRPSLRLQIDAKALAGNGELSEDVFRAVASDLVHYHANEPGFEVLGSSGTVDHAAAGAYLREIAYDGYVSIEQKMIGADEPFAAIEKSAAVLQECYR